MGIAKSMILVVIFVNLVLQENVSGLINSFGSKTPYGHYRSTIKKQSNLHLENQEHSCAYESIFLVARHGSRWPTIKYLKKFEKLKAVHLNHLNWSHTFDVMDEGLLTPIGEEEMKSLGERVREAFSSIFSKYPLYHPKRYEFKSSQALRALQSAFSFALGMFGHSRAFAIESDSKDKDYLLRFHDNCPSYTKAKKLSTPNLQEVLGHVLAKVKNRTKSSDAFDFKALDALWGACLFEATALNNLNGACTYFDVEDAKIMEYANDVEDYWEKSHGQTLNYQMACVLMTDILTSLENNRNRFYFGHAETIMPLIAFLGMFKDQDHLGSDFIKDTARKWRSGLISPFGANVIFASKICTSKASTKPSRYVEIRHNEHVEDMSHLCSHEGESPKMAYACSFEAFKKAIQQRIGQCNFQEMCNA